MMQHEDEYDQFRRQECKEITTEMFHVDLPVDEFLCDDVETGTGSYARLFFAIAITPSAYSSNSFTR